MTPPSIEGQHILRSGRCERKTGKFSLDPPLYLANVASLLRRDRHKNCTIKLMDFDTLDFSKIQCLDVIREFSPDYIVIHVALDSFYYDIQIIREIKKKWPFKTVIAIGTAATLISNDLLENGVDYCIKGEPELKTLQLLDRLSENKKSNDTRCNFVQHPDFLPFPLRESLPNDNYIMPIFGKTTSIIPSRGCGGRCTYCRVRYMHGVKIRNRSPGNIVDEMEECINRYNIKTFKFRGDNFMGSHTFISKFCDEIKSRKLNVNWFINSRSDSCTNIKLLKKLKDNGCQAVAIGTESGSDKILGNIKKDITKKQNLKAIKNLKKVDLTSHTYFILGLPGENKETIKETLNFIETAQPDFIAPNTPKPYPHTPLYNYMVKNDFLIDKDFWRKGIFIPRVKTKELSFEELRNYVKIVNEYNSKWRYLKYLSRINLKGIHASAQYLLSRCL